MTSSVELCFAPNHTWVRLDGEVAMVGVPDFVQEQLGDVMCFRLPTVGEAVRAGARFGVFQSFKSTPRGAL